MDPPAMDPPAPAPRPRTRLWRFVREAAILLVVLLVGLEVAGRLRAPDYDSAALAPDFTLQTTDGATLRLSELRGRIVVLNFWATWCPPCRLEIPAFARLAARRPDVTVLGIAADGSPETLRAAAADLGATYPVGRGAAEVFAAYGVGTYPTTVVIDPAGRIANAHTGLMLDPQLALALVGLGTAGQ